RTSDGGKNWERVLFVDENTGCADVAMDPKNPRIVFAGMWQFEIKTWGRFSGGPGSGLYRSADGGTTWTKVTGNGLPTHQIGKFGLAIARTDPNRIYALIETSDGVPWKGDEPDMWIDPTDANRMAVANDGGVAISSNRGRTWNRVQLPIAQMYHVTTDNDIPYHVLGNRQDGPSYRGPSNSKLPSLFGFSF